MEQIIPIIILIVAFMLITTVSIKRNRYREERLDESKYTSVRRVPQEFINSDFMDTSSSDTRRSHMRSEKDYSDSLQTQTSVSERGRSSHQEEYHRRTRGNQNEFKRRLQEKRQTVQNSNERRLESADKQPSPTESSLKSAFEALKEEYRKMNR